MAHDRAEAVGSPNFGVHLVGTCDGGLRRVLGASVFRYVLHGRISDHRELVRVFAMCQFVLFCSFEDNWPNILVEACSYGSVPIVGVGYGCEESARKYD